MTLAQLAAIDQAFDALLPADKRASGSVEQRLVAAARMRDTLDG